MTPSTVTERIRNRLVSDIEVIIHTDHGDEHHNLHGVTRDDICKLPHNCSINYQVEGLELATHNDCTLLMSLIAPDINISLSLALESLSIQLSTILARIERNERVNTQSLEESYSNLKATRHKLGLATRYTRQALPKRLTEIEALLKDISEYNQINFAARTVAPE